MAPWAIGTASLTQTIRSIQHFGGAGAGDSAKAPLRHTHAIAIEVVSLPLNFAPGHKQQILEHARPRSKAKPWALPDMYPRKNVIAGGIAGAGGLILAL